MPRDITIVLDDEPGMLAWLGEALGHAGINISGGCATVGGGEGLIHLLVEDDGEDAVGAIQAAGLPVRAERDVVVVDVRDQPGTLGSYARRLADAGVNIDLFYLATATRLVFGTDDTDAARDALG
jgi:hypothetical protein